MSELKTKKTTADVHAYLSAVENIQRRDDCLALLPLFEAWTGEKATMWGDSIVGFGSYHYKSERSRQEGDWPLTGFSPRKQNLTVYISTGFGAYENELKMLGPHKASVGCLYIKRLSDIDLEVLKKIVVDSTNRMRKNT